MAPSTIYWVEMSESSNMPPRPPRDYERTLGVVESFTVICEQCPSGAVRAVAARALETTRGGGAGVLREQAYFVLTAIQGWRGERASQVHRSLTAFLESTDRSDS
jgi:hypothetical protein